MRLTDECGCDLVLDTNVLSHADNSGSVLAEASLKVLEWIEAADVMWALDDTGKNEPDPSTSVLVMEYYETLSPQSYGLTLFTKLLASGRCIFVARPPRATAKMIQAMIPRNKKDRSVLGAAAGSQDKILVSNDFDDFSDSVRQAAAESLGVRIHSADDCVCD